MAQKNGGRFRENGGQSAGKRRSIGGVSAAKRRPLIPAVPLLPLIGAISFSFSFLLIPDEGGIWEGWVKSAYSSLATAES
jgi:hypothetical protein